MTFNHTLFLERLELYSQASLARKLGISPQTLNKRLKHNVENITLRQFLQICEITGEAPADFIVSK